MSKECSRKDPIPEGGGPGAETDTPEGAHRDLSPTGDMDRERLGELLH